MKKVLLILSAAHNGDCFYARPLIKKLIGQNKDVQFYFYSERNNFLFEDIENINMLEPNLYDKRGCDCWSPLCTYRKFPENHPYRHQFVFLHRDFIVINFWLGSWPVNHQAVDCRIELLNSTFEFLVKTVIKKYIELKYDNSIISVVNLPESNIDKFLKYKEENKNKYFLFYYNYSSISLLDMKKINHDYIIKEILNKYKNITIVLPEISKNSLLNNEESILDCSKLFDCQVTDYGENLVKLMYIASNCNLCVAFDIGACFYYNACLTGINVLHCSYLNKNYSQILLDNKKTLQNKYDSEFVYVQDDSDVINGIISKLNNYFLDKNSA
jgi:hypothetical protein